MAEQVKELSIDELKAVIAQKDKNEEQSLKIIQDLQKEVESKKDLKATPRVEIEGVTYVVTVASFTTKTGKVTAEELILDVEKCRELVAKGSHILMPKVK